MCGLSPEFFNAHAEEIMGNRTFRGRYGRRTKYKQYMGGSNGILTKEYTEISRIN